MWKEGRKEGRKEGWKEGRKEVGSGRNQESMLRLGDLKEKKKTQIGSIEMIMKVRYDSTRAE